MLTKGSTAIDLRVGGAGADAGSVAAACGGSTASR
jgi:hypothetical protein